MAGEDHSYCLWVKMQPCCASGMGDRCYGGIEAHHAGKRGMGQKAHDHTCIPLCTRHHAAFHKAVEPFKEIKKYAKRDWQDQRIAETWARWCAEQSAAADSFAGVDRTVATRLTPEMVDPAGPTIAEAIAPRLALVPTEPTPAVRTGWRCSSLPIAEHCGLAPALALEHREASGRAAAKGTAYHARAAGDPRAAELLDGLTAAERAEVMSWALPAPPPDSEFELALGLTPTCRYAPHGTPGNLTEGTTDIAWVDDGAAMVVDNKTGALPIEDGPLTLQVVAYGFAYADKVGADRMRLGIFYARTGRLEWSDVIPLDSELAADLWRRVTIAATKDPIAAPGRWCDGCYQRAHCPARLLPALAGPTAPELAPFVTGAADLDAPRAAKALRVIAAMREVADRVEEHVRAAVIGGLRIEEEGKVYTPGQVAGRSYADVGALERDGLAQYIRQGKPYDRWSWRKA